MGLFSRKKDKIKIFSPTNGELKPLSSLNDGVFSEKVLGNGFVSTQTQDGKVYAPISGTLLTVFPTGHAYGIESKEGLNILVHIGVDTVELNGSGFVSHVKQGQFINQGDLLATVDLNVINGANLISDVIVVVTSDSKIQPNEDAFKIEGKASIKEEVASL